MLRVNKFSWIIIAVFICSRSIFAQWSNDPSVNTPICTAVGDQGSPLIVTDGAGGAIITWVDAQESYGTDIYAQRIDALGYVQWMENGIPICIQPSYQGYPAIMPDGLGGAIIAWADSRSSSSSYDIYAQRVNASGVVLWTTNGAAICVQPKGQVYTAIVSDDVGGAIITWQDYRASTTTVSRSDIYAQRVDGAGNAIWSLGGVPICTADSVQEQPEIVTDGTGGAIVVWRDHRSEGGSGIYDLYAQRIDASGAVQWPTNGVVICDGTNLFSYSVMADGAGGAIITWVDRRNNISEIYVQRIDASGAVQWTENGLPICTGHSTGLPAIVSDGAGGAIITWVDSRRSGGPDIYAQRVNAGGTAQWAENGILCSGSRRGRGCPPVTSDGAGGAIITWSNDYDIFAQRVNVSGEILWDEDGVAISLMMDDQTNPKLVSDGFGGAIITWVDGWISGFDLYAQNVNADGTIGLAGTSVYNTNDNGHGSLRRAILVANAIPGTDVITFDIPTDDPGYDHVTQTWSIKPNSPLPVITDPVVIDGYTQPGASPNTNPPDQGTNAVLKIELDGSSAGFLDGLCITSDNSTVRGLVINRFLRAGINLETNGNNVIEGNFIGTDVTGTVTRANESGVRILNSSNNTIGGATPEARNVISGNFIGIRIEDDPATANLVQGNFIGTDISGIADLHNSHGVYIGSVCGNTIGGMESGTGNTIAFNDWDGILVTGGTGNAILSNSIFANGELGIDLGSSGEEVTPNDLGDGDTGPNNLQNFPVLTSAVRASGSITITGTLNSTPNTEFILQFFSNSVPDASNHGEGENYLGSATETTDGSGNVSFTVTLPDAVPTDHYISATATDPDGNTSEFSECAWVGVIPAIIYLDFVIFFKQGHGPWVTAYIELLAGFDPADINVASVVFEGNLPGQVLAAEPTAVGDYDNDGIPDRMVKFNAYAVDAVLAVGSPIEVRIHGELTDGTEFTGTRNIIVDAEISCGDSITSDVILTNDILDCPCNGIIIIADDITVDGDGYKITGTGDCDGIILQDVDNVTVQHLYTMGFENGILVRAGEGNNIYMNRMQENAVGLSLSEGCTGTTVNNNIIADNSLGLNAGTSDNSIYHNQFINNVDMIEDVGGNTWVDPVGGLGNHWSNYWGLDDGSNGRVAGDFIGDTDLPHEGVDDAPVMDPSMLGPFLAGDWWHYSSWLIWRGGWSPVVIQVTNPAGQTISRDEDEIGLDAFYVEYEDIHPGTTLVYVSIGINTLNPYEGVYTFQMTGLEDLTYWMEWFASDSTGRLVYQLDEDVPLAAGETRNVYMILETIIDPETGDTIIVAQQIVPSLALKNMATNELEDLKLEVSEDAALKIDEGLYYLYESLTPEWWIDDSHLDHDQGDDVFDKENDCVEKLMELLEKVEEYELTPEQIAVLEEVIQHQIVKADSLLAMVAFVEAIEAGISQEDSIDVEEQLADAYHSIELGEWDQACEDYGDAWGEAVDALDELPGGPQTAGRGNLPSVFTLSTNQPNPFNSMTTLRYALPKNEQVKLTVYDASGRVVKTLVHNEKEAGYHTILWDGRDGFGHDLPNGIYFYRLDAGDFTEIKKMVLIR